MNTLGTSEPSVGARGASLALRAAHALGRTLGQPLLLDRPTRFWLDRVAPLWSTRELRARVVAIVDEARDVKTFVLEPGVGWPGHRAGQYVPVEVEIDGSRARRCYSISSPPGGRYVALTVKRVEGGRVSSFLHARVRRGDLIVLGEPAGDFVVQDDVPAKMLLLSGGSGVTPVMSILRDLHLRGRVGDVVFLHAARSREDAPFARELARLAFVHPGLRVELRLDDRDGRLDAASLRATVPDLAERDTWLCGPTGMMDAVAPAFVEAGVASRVRREHFVAAPLPRKSGSSALVRLGRSKKTIATTGQGTLLEELERAGERPAHGCRMGICNTCRCRKRAGVVEDVRTGALSTEPDEEIRLCTSIARSDVELAL